MRNPTKMPSVKRWDAISRSCSDWDGLRRDEELWQEDGDCLVHLYEQGKSKRGSSFRISHAVLLSSGFETFFYQYLAPKSSSEHYEFELYIPVPEDTSRDGAFSWHLTTRNFLAWILNKPLVGVRLGQTLIDLHERTRAFCPDMPDRTQKLLNYIHEQGYSSFTNSPEYALACLNFAENVKLRDLWIDAFSHCVGMNDKLDLCPEFDDVSMVTKALITRSYLEMDLHLGRVSRALRTFLEDELSSAHLGLPAAARAHLERFRSFLHSYHVNKFGYWPPGEEALLDKSVLTEMAFEFQTLYDYLADNDASTSPKAASGGICVLQNVDAFNTRHNYEPLPHSSPLLPNYQVMDYKTPSQKSLRSFKLGSKTSKFEEFITARSSLAVATNTTPECALVHDFMYFERELTFKQDERLTVADGRKVRWIVVYAILQMLVNAIRAPEEVHETEFVPYHLCVLVAGTPPFTTDKAELSKNEVSLAQSEDSTVPMMLGDDKDHSATPSIHPDCENDEYFTRKTMPVVGLRPPPLRINTNVGVTRSSSIKGLHRSLTSFSLPSRGNSLKLSRRHSTKPSPRDSLMNEFSPSDSKRHSGYSFAIPENIDVDYLHPISREPDATLQDHISYSEARARTPTFDADIFDFSPSDSPSTPSSYTSSNELSATSRMWGNSSIDFSATSIDGSEPLWDDLRNSRRIYSMDHDSVCGVSDSDQSRKCSTASLLSGTASPAISVNVALREFQRSRICQPQPKRQVPDWYMEGQFNDELLGFPVRQETLQDDGVAQQRMHRRMDSKMDDDMEVEPTVDIFEALCLMDKTIEMGSERISCCA